MKKITSVLFLFYCFSVGWAQTVPPCTLEITDALIVKVSLVPLQPVF